MLNFPPELYLSYNGMYVSKLYIILKGSWGNIDLTDLIAKQAS